MAKNTTKSALSSKRKKPDKPHPDYLRFAHATGQWAKKISGKHHYFGKWDDPDGALEPYLETYQVRFT